MNVSYKNIDFSQYRSNIPFIYVKYKKIKIRYMMVIRYKIYDRNISQNLFGLKFEEKNSIKTEIDLQIFS